MKGGVNAVQATVVAKEKIAHETLKFYNFCVETCYCRKNIRSTFVTLLTTEEGIDAGGTEGTSQGGG